MIWCHSCQLRHFNPRSPQGERRAIINVNIAEQLFQSTLPAGGATARPAPALRGGGYFNPRSPQGERLSVINIKISDTEISIHAPRRGSD